MTEDNLSHFEQRFKTGDLNDHLSQMANNIMQAGDLENGLDWMACQDTAKWLLFLADKAAETGLIRVVDFPVEVNQGCKVIEFSRRTGKTFAANFNNGNGGDAA